MALVVIPEWGGGGAAFNPLSWQADFSELEARVVYKGSSRTARNVIQRNPISKKQNKSKPQQQIQSILIYMLYVYILCIN